MDTLLDGIKEQVRRPIRQLARGLNKITNGKLHPNVVTFFGLAMHIPIAIFIASGDLILAAGLLVVFGLFDALDGALAKVQNRASTTGMFLDSVTDRMKEVILYAGIISFLLQQGADVSAIWAILALGGSMLTTYINAWGDVAMSKAGAKNHVINEGFRGGLMRFEVRMFLLVVALLANQLRVFVVVVALLAWFTAFQRIARIIRKLEHV